MTGPRATPLRALLLEKGQALFSGRIDVDTGGLQGVLHLSDGLLLDARIGTATGEPALWRLLLHPHPRLSAEPGKPRATSGAALGKPDALLARFDERYVVLERYAEKVGGFDRVWAIRFDALAAVLEDLPDAINPVLRLLDGKRTVRQVVTECALDDMLALRIIGKLLASGILVLPDESLAPQADASGAVDIDDGLEAALAASLAEIDAEERASAGAGAGAGAAEPIPLTTRTNPPSSAPAAAAPAPPAAAPAPAAAAPAPAAAAPAPAAAAPAPAAAAPAPAAAAPAPAAAAPAPAAAVPAPAAAAPAPAAAVPAPAAHAVSTGAAALPTAPPVVTNDELRAWLGNEEAFFSRPPTVTTGDVPMPPQARPILGLPALAVMFVLAVVLGALIAKSC